MRLQTDQNGTTVHLAMAGWQRETWSMAESRTVFVCVSTAEQAATCVLSPRDPRRSIARTQRRLRRTRTSGSRSVPKSQTRKRVPEQA